MPNIPFQRVSETHLLWHRFRCQSNFDTLWFSFSLNSRYFLFPSVFSSSFFLAAPETYGSSQAWECIWAAMPPGPQLRQCWIFNPVCHSRNSWFLLLPTATAMPHLQTMPQLEVNLRSLTHWAGSGMEPASSWVLVGFLTTGPSPLHFQPVQTEL